MAAMRSRGRTMTVTSLNPPTTPEAQAMIADSAPLLARLIDDAHQIAHERYSQGQGDTEVCAEVDALFGVQDEEAEYEAWRARRAAKRATMVQAQ